jgi:hypothetical protein
MRHLRRGVVTASSEARPGGALRIGSQLALDIPYSVAPHGDSAAGDFFACFDRGQIAHGPLFKRPFQLGKFHPQLFLTHAVALAEETRTAKPQGHQPGRASEASAET